jgi:predicted DNA-binding transcriptional regulator YafY
MYFPSTRMLGILDLLRSHGQLTATELARYLEVDARTVRRYMTMLQDLGMPVESEFGRYGGYRLRPGYKLPPIVFSDDEVLALTLGLLFARQLGLVGIVKAAETAIAKMTRVMPGALQEQVEIMDKSLVMQVPLPQASLSSEIIITLSQASYRRQRVWLRYRDTAGRETQREIEPYGLVYTIGLWYVAGYCHLRQALRSFRIDRVLQAELRAETFTPPANFKALEYVEESITRKPGLWLTEVLLQTDLEQAKRLIPPATAMLEETEHGTKVNCYTGDLDGYARLLVGLDCPLLVLSPLELCQALQRLAAKANSLATQLP